MKKIIVKLFWFAVFASMVCANVLMAVYAFAELIMSNEDCPAWFSLVVIVAGMVWGVVPAMLTAKEFGIINRLND